MSAKNKKKMQIQKVQRKIKKSSRPADVLEEERLEQPGLASHRVLAVEGQLLGGDVLAVQLAVVQELNDVVQNLVPQRHHVLGEVLEEGEEAPLGVEPRFHAQLALVRLEGLDDAGDAEVEVGLGAVEGADDDVDDAQVEDLPVRVLVRHPLLLLLDLPHQFLRLLVLTAYV